MKLRNHLLALAILLGFLSLGTLYVRWWVVQPRPFAIILVLSDGLISRHLTAARLYADGTKHHLAMENPELGFSHTALLRNDAADFAVPDAASAATAIATGQKTRHHHIAVGPDDKPLTSILELARDSGRSVGLVTNGRLTEPSSAAFYAHQVEAEDTDRLAATLVEQHPLNVVFGGGAEDFLPAGAGHRKDGKDLLAKLTAPLWDVVGTKAELESAAPARKGSLIGLFANGPLAFSKQRDGGSDQPSLADMTRRAIQCLETNRNGYVLVIDETLVSQASVLGEGESLLRETLELDLALKTAVAFAGERTLIVGVGKHSTGGFALNGYPAPQDKGLALLAPKPSGQPSVTWATGPKHPSEPTAFATDAALNNAEDVLVIGRGIGAEKIHGFMDNTKIFQLVRDSL